MKHFWSGRCFCLSNVIGPLFAGNSGFVDLRFPSNTVETQYKQSLEGRLVLASFVMCLLLNLGWAFYADEIRREVSHEGNPYVFSGDDPRSLRFMMTTLSFLVFPAMLANLAILKLRGFKFRSLDWESLAVFIPTLISLLMPWINGWTVTELYGQSSSEVWIRDMSPSVASAALFLDGVTTTVSLFIPVRMHLKCVPALTGCASFTFSVLFVGSPFPGHTGGDVFALCALTFCALWGARNNEQQSRQSWIARGAVKEKSQQLVQQHIGNARILDCLCDCVLQLDCEFRIVDPSPRLCALLLCSDESLKTNYFCDYISSTEDRQHFIAELEGRRTSNTSSETGIPGGMLHIKLNDSWGRQFKVSAYHTSVYDLEGECGHTVALLEAEERELPWNETVQLPVAEHIIQRGSEASEHTGTTVTPPLSVHKQEIAAWVDAASFDLKIVSCSPGFMAFGPSAVRNGLTCLVVGSAEPIKECLQIWSNLYLNNNHLEQELQPCPLTLRISSDASIVFKANCSPDFETRIPSNLEGEDDWSLLRIVLSDVKCHRSRSKDVNPHRGSVPTRLRTASKPLSL